MFPRTVEAAFARFRKTGDARAMAIVFDRTAPELLRLARHLARGRGDDQAEDLVQTTFLTAIEKADQHDGERPVLPWLCGVLANAARMQRRAAARVPAPERLRLDVVRDVHDEVQGGELRAEVQAAIDKLPEAYRPVLRLWLEHGLEAREIAATLERPEGTVRAQVSRGLEQLRRALPASVAGAAAVAVGAGRGLAAVRAEVLSACAGTSHGIAATIAVTGLLMLHHKLLVGGVAAALALLLWFAWPPAEAAPRPGDATTSSEVEAARADAITAAEVDDAQVDVGEREALTAPDVVDAPAKTTAVDGETSLVVRVTDRDTGAPLAGYHIALGDAGSQQAFGVRPDFVATDRNGEVAFDGIDAGQMWVFVDRMQNASVADVRPGRRNRHTIALAATATIEGTVTAPDGQPVAGATIYAVANWVQPIPLTTADRQGRFSVRHASDPRLMARHRGYQPSLAQVVRTGAGNTHDVTLQLGAGGRTIRGVVLDADGAPLQATIAVLPQDALAVHPWNDGRPLRIALSVATDRDARFETDEVAPGAHMVLAVPHDRDLSPVQALVDTTPGEANVTLRAARPTTIEGRLIGEGLRTADLRILAFPEQPAEDCGYLINLVGLRTTFVQKDGTYRLRGVPAGAVVLRAMGDTEPVAETRLEVQAGETHRWDPQLHAVAALTVHVTSATDALPDGLFVIVHTGVHGVMPTMAPLPPNGTAQLELPRQGPVDVTLAIAVGRQFTQLARELQVPPERREVQFDLHADQLPVRSVQGRLVDAQQAPLAGRTLTLRRVDESQLVAVRSAVTADDGAFSIGPLPAGRYELALGPFDDLRALTVVTVTADRDEQLGEVTAPR